MVALAQVEAPKSAQREVLRKQMLSGQLSIGPTGRFLRLGLAALVAAVVLAFAASARADVAPAEPAPDATAVEAPATPPADTAPPPATDQPPPANNPAPPADAGGGTAAIQPDTTEPSPDP